MCFESALKALKLELHEMLELSMRSTKELQHLGDFVPQMPTGALPLNPTLFPKLLDFGHQIHWRRPGRL